MSRDFVWVTRDISDGVPEPDVRLWPAKKPVLKKYKDEWEEYECWEVEVPPGKDQQKYARESEGACMCAKFFKKFTGIDVPCDRVLKVKVPAKGEWEVINA